jgi:hypothetical protein
MIDRRSFLSSAAGLGLAPGAGFLGRLADGEAGRMRHALPAGGLPRETLELAKYEATLSACHRLDPLGFPHSWSLVREGFHPVSPQRVAIMPSDICSLGLSRLGSNLVQVGRRIVGVGGTLDKHSGKPAYGDEKLYASLAIMDYLTNYHRASDHLDDWALALCRREALGSTAYWRGFGLVHQFQPMCDPVPVEVTNPPVDWWLFLFPSGIVWEAIYDEPVYCLAAAVFHKPMVGLSLRVWCLISAAFGRLSYPSSPGNGDAARRLANMDRVSAARTFNLAVADIIEAWGPRF